MSYIIKYQQEDLSVNVATKSLKGFDPVNFRSRMLQIPTHLKKFGQQYVQKYKLIRENCANRTIVHHWDSYFLICQVKQILWFE